ncbi:L-serine dehydratase [Helicobacter suis]|uniref:L-serine ammonia-lyase n=1 Tax=Helicobacter suis TaxID=104628 RepID=UPI0015813312|nr:L-serine ammonia-lyase [Helicobacter suis]GFK16467.1 L-serine dehydratase [Helicobacter suis]
MPSSNQSITAIFKIGIGPSSSHTIGPMDACARFCALLYKQGLIEQVNRVRVILHGSLALTGKGHLTDLACIVGLSGVSAREVRLEQREVILKQAIQDHKILLAQKKEIDFSLQEDILFDSKTLPLHENGMEVQAFNAHQKLLVQEIYYSTGGGFIYTQEELQHKKNSTTQDCHTPFDFASAKELENLCEKHHTHIAGIVEMHENALFKENYARTYCLEIYQTMLACYQSGISSSEKSLPGYIGMASLAPKIYTRLIQSHNKADPLSLVDYITLYARAVSEENARGHRVVTAPTNGACGVVPAVLLYCHQHIKPLETEQIVDFLLTCAAIGYLYKRNGSLSGAEAGCQAEVGTASSMAAAGFAFVMGGSVEQVLSAAEITMEHHLGLTCDPVGGLVQIPCIERNVVGAIKAVSSARLALEDGYQAKVSLDDVISTMYEVGKSLDPKYRETSLGGLATHVHIPRC